MLELKDSYIQRVRGAFGIVGTEWFKSLPSILEQILLKWDVTVLEIFADLSYNFVAKVVHKDGTQYVLKLGPPHKELFTEMEALKLFDGRGSVKLINADNELGALLLELLEPGKPIINLEDDESATQIAGQVMGQLWLRDFEASKFPTVAYWGSGFERYKKMLSGGNGSFPKKWIAIAEGLYSDLVSTMDESVLLHGDLHHWNILSAQRQPWLAIDPKGVIGEPAYEIGAWLRNPFPFILSEGFPDRVILRRASQLSEQLGFDRDRILAWGAAQAVLAAWWSYLENQEEWKSWLEVAKIIYKIS